MLPRVRDPHRGSPRPIPPHPGLGADAVPVSRRVDDPRRLPPRELVVTAAVVVVMVLMGALAIACALRATPASTDPNDLAPHDRLTGDPIDDDDPDLPYGMAGN